MMRFPMNHDEYDSINELYLFQKRIGLDSTEMEVIGRYRDIFIEKKDAFSEKFFNYFHAFPETKLYLEDEDDRKRLCGIWEDWFEDLFTKRFSEDFLLHHWRSGLRHVEIKIDHRFIMLGYCLLRQFCLDIAGAQIPAGDRFLVNSCIDKMIDFCLLIETQALLKETIQCDIEVIKGIAHQFRNPLTVIGGNIARVIRNTDIHSPEYRVFDTILSEIKRLEATIKDVSVYSRMFQKPPDISTIALEDLVNNALDELEKILPGSRSRAELALDPSVPFVRGDPDEIQKMFFYLLQNALEALTDEKPMVTISSKRADESSPYIELEIFNTGRSIDPEELPNLFAPFYSSKARGSGFGLPIARLAVERSLGKVLMEPVPGKGTRCLVKLPILID